MLAEDKINNPFFDIRVSTVTKLLLVLLFITALRGGGYIASIAPWQSPDEPTHFEYARILTEGGSLFSPQPDLDLQKRIIFSMDRGNYWRLVSAEEPDPLPENFFASSFFFPAPSQLKKNPPLYYFIASLFLRLGDGRSVLNEMYQLRILSLLFTLISIIFVFAVAREFAPSQPLFWLTAAAFTAFLPQFMVIGTSVSPDPLINMVGSALILVVMRSLRLKRKIFPLMLVCVLFVIGLLTSYKILMLLPPLALWLAVLCAKLRPAGIVRRFLITLAIALVASVIFVIISPRLIQVYSQRLGVLADNIQLIFSGQTSAPTAYWARFRWELFMSTWLRVGWPGFLFSSKIYHILLLFVLASAAGLTWTMVKTVSSARKWQEGQAISLLVLVAFAFSVLFSYYAFWGFRFGDTSTQGRHFFIVIPAGAVLLVLGWGSLFPRRWRNLAYILFISGMVLVDLLALFCYIRPAFAW